MDNSIRVELGLGHLGDGFNLKLVVDWTGGGGVQCCLGSVQLDSTWFDAICDFKYTIASTNHFNCREIQVLVVNLSRSQPSSIIIYLVTKSSNDALSAWNYGEDQHLREKNDAYRYTAYRNGELAIQREGCTLQRSYITKASRKQGVQICYRPKSAAKVAKKGPKSALSILQETAEVGVEYSTIVSKKRFANAGEEGANARAERRGCKAGLTDPVTLLGGDKKEPYVSLALGITNGVVLAPREDVLGNAELHPERASELGNGDGSCGEGIIDGCADGRAAVEVAGDAVASIEAAVLEVQLRLLLGLGAASDDAEGPGTVTVSNVQVDLLLGSSTEAAGGGGGGGATARGGGTDHGVGGRRRNPKIRLKEARESGKSQRDPMEARETSWGAKQPRRDEGGVREWREEAQKVEGRLRKEGGQRECGGRGKEGPNMCTQMILAANSLRKVKALRKVGGRTHSRLGDASVRPTPPASAIILPGSAKSVQSKLPATPRRGPGRVAGPRNGRAAVGVSNVSYFPTTTISALAPLAELLIQAPLVAGISGSSGFLPQRNRLELTITRPLDQNPILLKCLAARRTLKRTICITWTVATTLEFYLTPEPSGEFVRHCVLIGSDLLSASFVNLGSLLPGKPSRGPSTRWLFIIFVPLSRPLKEKTHHPYSASFDIAELRAAAVLCLPHHRGPYFCAFEFAKVLFSFHLTHRRGTPSVSNSDTFLSRLTALPTLVFVAVNAFKLYALGCRTDWGVHCVACGSGCLRRVLYGNIVLFQWNAVEIVIKMAGQIWPAVGRRGQKNGGGRQPTPYCGLATIWHSGQTSGRIRRHLANFGWADGASSGQTWPDGIFTGVNARRTACRTVTCDRPWASSRTTKWNNVNGSRPAGGRFELVEVEAVGEW
ncbi:hypothetical protein C8F04DRAFT_1178218 [Mycena alexandri]|uniref:Uncharacterized protein n=1 Tax=Mycena alexandri TaxID=1745969 RepID=A0AAD6X5U8_9AGAR|nr:hypothetical protein C8F04DRAFT_1178218 [Mycena alexandri]